MAKAKGFKRVLVLAASVFIVLGLIAEGAVADQLSVEDSFGGHINNVRAGNGRPSVVMDETLRNVARAHSAGMAGSGSIFHNPALAAQVPGGWRAIGENVGVGQSVDSIHHAFMNSPGHAANVLGDYDRVGVGVVTVGSTIYVTEVFFKSGAAPAGSKPVASAPAKRICRKVGRRVSCSATKVKAKKKVKARKSRSKARRR